MALFAAYANAVSGSANDEENKEPEQQDWLKLSSFKVDGIITTAQTSSVQEIQDSSSYSGSENVADVPMKSKRKKKDKHRSKRQKNIDQPKVNVHDEFKIDTTRNKEFLTVRTISRPSAPKYKVELYLGRQDRSFKKRKFKRYYKVVHEIINDNSEPETEITKKDLNKPVTCTKDEEFKGFQQEADMSQTTANFNRALSENPTDIEIWLKYVRFQDTVFHFEKTYRKGSIAKGLRITAERKLSIIDKALSQNPNCEALLRERLNIAVNVYPSDELQVHLKQLIEKEQGNIILWQGYIEATQCSMSHCNTPAVLKLYTKCLLTLHQLRRTLPSEQASKEENILHMLYQCGLFLRQAGLFEQLWTLLRLYLELNLSPVDKNTFNIDSCFRDKQLEELEEVILNSQLPIHELWLRIEKLRESCHWLPYIGDDCEDPQRLVFPEDVAELIHPITMAGNNFKLTATILTLLKIPLLPCRHTTMQDLGLDYVPWALDSVEVLLPIFLPLYPVDTYSVHLLKDTQRLAVGPQYLKTLPGQEEYLDFLLNTMRNCIDCLCGNEKTAIILWWFKFQRLLIVLDKRERYKMSATFKKKIKNSMKNLLKLEEHRNNPAFYEEYALVEHEMGNFESAVNILTTAISLNYSGKETTLLADEEARSAVCSLYRKLTEIHIGLNTETDKQKALKYLVYFALNKDFKKNDVLTQGAINEAALKYKHITALLLQKQVMNLTLVNHFMPNFFTDWIICNGWFLYLTKGVIECGTFVENILFSLDDVDVEISWQKEVLFEFYVASLFKDCLERPGSGYFKILDDVLHRAIEKYPNNLFLLTALAKEQSINCSVGQSWWKLNSLLMKTGRAISTLFLILIANQKICETEESWIDTFTGQQYSDSSYKNRMMAMFRRLTASGMCTRRCGLVWRLYLQFLHAHFDLSYCRKAYYAAVEECPWLKALYIDAAIYIPAELPQIQDLLIEKQLRLHVTPEELDVLRN